MKFFALLRIVAFDCIELLNYWSVLLHILTKIAFPNPLKNLIRRSFSRSYFCPRKSGWNTNLDNTTHCWTQCINADELTSRSPHLKRCTTYLRGELKSYTRDYLCQGSKVSSIQMTICQRNFNVIAPCWNPNWTPKLRSVSMCKIFTVCPLSNSIRYRWKVHNTKKRNLPHNLLLSMEPCYTTNVAL